MVQRASDLRKRPIRAQPVYTVGEFDSRRPLHIPSTKQVGRGTRIHTVYTRLLGVACTFMNGSLLPWYAEAPASHWRTDGGATNRKGFDMDKDSAASEVERYAEIIRAGHEGWHPIPDDARAIRRLVEAELEREREKLRAQVSAACRRAGDAEDYAPPTVEDLAREDDEDDHDLRGAR